MNDTHYNENPPPCQEPEHKKYVRTTYTPEELLEMENEILRGIAYRYGRFIEASRKRRLHQEDENS